MASKLEDTTGEEGNDSVEGILSGSESLADINKDETETENPSKCSPPDACLERYNQSLARGEDDKVNKKSENVRSLADVADDEEILTVWGKGDASIKVLKRVLVKIPYFSTLLSGRWTVSESIHVGVNDEFLKACIKFAESDFESPSRLLSKLPRSINACLLVADLDFLGIDLPVVRSVEELQDLEKRIRDVKEEGYVKIARKTYERSYDVPDRIGAKNAAAELCFSLLKRTINTSVNKIRQKITTDVLFVLSHARTFGPRLRTHLWKAFNELVTPTKRQMKNFDRWVSEESLKFDFNGDDGRDSDESRSDGECSTGSVHEHVCYDSDCCDSDVYFKDW